MSEYARMDSQMQSAQKAIGGSSDTAQLSQSYYWDKVARGEFDDECQQYYENTVILAVCAQLAIDGCKKVFAVDVNDDIKRIRGQQCMKRKKDYPKFMQWTHDIPVTKNGKERPYEDIKKDRNRVKQRIDENIICPMNWLEDTLDKIQGADKKDCIDTKEFFINNPGKAHNVQMSKIRKAIEEYDKYTKRTMLLLSSDPDNDSLYDLLIMKTKEIYDRINKFKISTITMNRLVGSVLGIDKGINKAYKNNEVIKYTRKMLNMMYRINKDNFLKCFISTKFGTK